MTAHPDAAPRSTAEEFVISRVFDAPRALVFRAFAEAERLAQWWGPKGFTIHVSKLEFRPGGVFHYRMAGPNGHDMWGQFHYREIVEPERIVFVNTFSDPDGGLTRAPFGPKFESYPLEVLNTVTLAEQDGKTALTLRAAPINATDAERAMFASMLDSMRQGYGGTWDKLDAFLAREQAAA
jgi:uncharacterized protein YndB with AHSA1/START domain